MTSRAAAWFLPLAACFLAAPLAGQAVRRVAARVTFVAGRSFYLDQGREAGIEPGDTVIVSPVAGSPVEGRVIAISGQSCSAELTAPAVVIGPGDRAEILVPVGRGANPASPRPTSSGPSRPVAPVEHPPWTRPLDPNASSEAPLLAPAFGKTRPREPMRLSGRIHANGFHTWDTGSGRDSRYMLGRVGIDLELANPGDLGGRVHFAGEASRRATLLEDAPDTSDTSGRVDRLSYRHGDGRADTWRYEVGRFLQNELPELGVLDGAEVAYQTESVGRFGASVGAMPSPFPNRASGDDLQVALFHRLAFGEHEELVSVLGLQKTWHDGDADRDLLLWNLEAHPSGPVSFRTSTWIDLYGNSDTVKGSGPELTQFQAQGSYAIDPDTGIQGFGTYLRWPELLREEFAALPAERIRDAHVLRYGLSGWHRLDKRWRFDARVDAWNDERASGLGGEIRAAARDWAFPKHELSFALFQVAGSFLSGPGIRVTSTHWWETSSLRLGYEIARYGTESLSTGSETLVQQALVADYDWHFADAWDLSLSADARFGDGAGSFTLGIYVQTRF